MIDEKIREQIIALMKREVVPAVGCTEPMAVALCVARATEALGCRPEKITTMLSANILKNAMGVGIPGTGMIGLPIAIALGAIIGKSEYQLEVLKDVNPKAIEQGKQYIDEGRINIQLKQDCCDKLYVEAIAEADGHTATAIIQDHTPALSASPATTRCSSTSRPATAAVKTKMKSPSTCDSSMISPCRHPSTRSSSSLRPVTITSRLPKSHSRATTATAWARPWTGR